MKLIHIRKSIIATALAGIATLATTASARQAPAPLSKTKSATVQATVEAIDKTNRIVTLKGPKGNLVDVQATEKLKRFNDLKVGDVITATYSESVALTVRKPGEAAPLAEGSGVNKQGKTGVMATSQKTITVSVEEIDKTVPSITVKGPQGGVYSFRVQDPKRLEGVNVGDNIDVTYTVGLLLKADRPSK